MNNKTQRREIDRLCRRIAESFNSDEAINKFKNLLQENPEMLESIEEAIHSLQEDKRAFKELEELKRYDLPQQKISPKALENFIDDAFGDDETKLQQVPNIIYLADLNSDLTKVLGLNHSKVYFLKNDLCHNNPNRKSKYDQELPLEIFKNLQNIIENSKEAYADTEHKNFFIIQSLTDEELNLIGKSNSNKRMAMFSFNKDKDGNLVLHTKRVNNNVLKNGMFKKVSPTGVAPAISTTLNERLVAATSLHASSDTDEQIISQNPNKSQAILQYDGGMALKSIRELEAKKQENLQTMQESIDEFKKENKVRKI